MTGAGFRFKMGWSAALILLVAAVPSVTSARGWMRFHMTGTVQETVTPDAACQGFRVVHTGTLQGVPLGQARWSGSECVDFVAQPGGVTVRDGVFSLSDGLLTGTYSARGGLPDASGRVYVWGQFQITGGSGKCASARGGGILTAVADVMAGTAEIDLNGDLAICRTRG